MYNIAVFSVEKHTSFNMYNIPVFSVLNILVLICTNVQHCRFFCRKHTSFNMYNIPVFSVLNILVLICTTYRFFRISVVKILVLTCTSPFFPYFYSKHTSFDMYNIPVFSVFQ